MPIPATPTTIVNNPSVTLLSPGVVPALAFDKAFVAADILNGNCFQATGDDTLVVFNPDEGPHNITVWSAADSFGRYANVTYQVSAGVHSFIRIIPGSLYTQPGTNTIVFSCDSALLDLAVVTNP